MAADSSGHTCWAYSPVGMGASAALSPVACMAGILAEANSWVSVAPGWGPADTYSGHLRALCMEGWGLVDSSFYKFYKL